MGGLCGRHAGRNEVDRRTQTHGEAHARLLLRNPDLFTLYRAQRSSVAQSLRTTKERTGGRLSVTTMSAATASIADVSRTDFTNTDGSRDRNKSGKTDEIANQTVSDSYGSGTCRTEACFWHFALILFLT